jgi:hypothetical protein
MPRTRHSTSLVRTNRFRWVRFFRQKCRLKIEKLCGASLPYIYPGEIARGRIPAAGETARQAPPRIKGRTQQKASENLPVTILRGSHPFPSRTRKLSLAGPMVLHAKVCGRLGDRRHNSQAKSPLFGAGFLCFGAPVIRSPGRQRLSYVLALDLTACWR